MTPFVDQLSNIRACFASPFQPPINCGGVTDCDWTLYGGSETMRPFLEYGAAALCLYALIQALLKAKHEGTRAALPGMMQCVVAAFWIWTIPQLSPEHFSQLMLPLFIPIALAPFAAAIWLVFKLSKKAIWMIQRSHSSGKQTQYPLKEDQP